MRPKVPALLLVSLLASPVLAASVRHVPASYSTIQAAINASINGDTVLVASGTYHENINFRGKRIVVESEFVLTREYSSVEWTIIDGSTPVSPDTASCVVIASGEDSTAVLEGFTLTGGTGTRWQDKHNLSYYREAGGVLTENSSPTIRNNRIVYNTATNRTGVTSAGGGGIRSDGGTPHILNNIIAFNSGHYGAGITLNYTGADIRNNIIYANTGGEDFGGSGIWSYATFSTPIIVENNTIVGNRSVLDGGGVIVWSTSMTLRNNVIWGNTAPTGAQVSVQSGNATVLYCDVQGGWPGTGNISHYPMFEDSLFLLATGSPCIDAGDPDPVRNDPPNDLIPTKAQWPSMGGTRNDIGAFGGPARRILRVPSSPTLNTTGDSLFIGYVLAGGVARVAFAVNNTGATSLRVDSVGFAVNADGALSVLNAFPRSVSPFAPAESLIVRWHPLTTGILRDTLLVYHNGTNVPIPYHVRLFASSVPTAILAVDISICNLGDIDHRASTADTTVVVRNVGTGGDSVYVSIDPKTVTPSNALQASPAGFALAAGDSQAVTFSILPTAVLKVGLGVYSPVLRFDSRFGAGTTHLEKIMRFRIINWTGVHSDPGHAVSFGLDQNYPNPFNPTTTIEYAIPVGTYGRTSLRVYDLLGREVAILVNERKAPGRYTVQFNAPGLASGVYFYRLTVGSPLTASGLDPEPAGGSTGFVQTRRMTLVR